MKIVELIQTKKEAFTVFEDGHIVRETGKFKPTPPSRTNEIPLPQKPTELSEYDMVSSFWGIRVYRQNYALWRWERDCQKIKERNDYNYMLNKKALKEKISSLRKRYRQQQALKYKNICLLERIGNYMFGGERS